MIKTLDEILNDLVSDHIDIPSMDKESCLAWIEDCTQAKALIEQAVMGAKPEDNCMDCDGVSKYEANLKAWLGKGK